MGLIRVSSVSAILRNIFENWNEVPKSIEMGHILARWFSSDDPDTALYAQSIIGWILGSTPERNDNWIELATRVSSGLAEHDLGDNINDGGDSVLLAILIQVTREYCSESGNIIWGVLHTLCKLDITKTLPRLQHDFCTLWNEIAQNVMRSLFTTSTLVLQLFRPFYIALHQGSDACPAAFCASTYEFRVLPIQQPEYPLCNLANHHSDSAAHVPVPNPSALSLPGQSGNSLDASSRSPSRSSSIASQQVEQGNIIAGPPFQSNSMTTSKIGESSQDLSAIPHTFPINSGPPLFPPAADACDDSLRDSHDQNQTIPMEIFHHQTRSLTLVSSPPDTASNSLEHEGK